MCFAPQRRALFRNFFDIWTSKSGPRPSVFNTFDLEMCFAPQRRALFRHLNFQKWSEPLVFWTFWLRNVLRATTACTFSTSQLPKVLRPWCGLYILTWKCASRHNGVQFFISHLASWLRTRRFSEPTFRPSGAPNHWKNTVFRDFPTLSRTCIFFLLILSLLTLLTSAFQLSILSEVSLLNFLRSFNMLLIMLHICTYNVIMWFHDCFMMDTLYYCYTFVSTVGVTGMAAGRLATLACGLTIDGFGPISDNAGGIAEMALFNPEAWNIMEWHGMAGKTEGHRAKICEDMRRWGLLD